MDFDLSEEQTMLKDGLDRMLANEYAFEDRNRHMAEPEGYSQAMWARYAEMGLMMLPFAEADGGLGGGAEDIMLVMESFGRALVLEPWFATVVLGGGFLREGGSEAQRGELVPALAEGSLKLAFAHTERHARYDLAHVETTATKQGGSYILNGAKSIVLNGDTADKVFVSARVSGGVRDEDGLCVFLVDADADGLSRRGYRLQDGSRAAEVTLENVTVDASRLFGAEGGAFPLIAKVTDQAIAALCAEAVGIMEVMEKLTVEYLKTRKQFGVEIAKFQVLQHAAVDMFIALEQARSITMYATMMADSDDALERGRAISAAKAEIGRGGRLAGENAIQLHGGVGMTMEYAIGHYFKRITMIDILFGDTDHHLAKLTAQGGLFEAA
ncbi:MAG: acyl-CoA dehydrogenase family protein [Zhengella sp.]|uniref:acyl-CoA dehydrogenase family protein n=1 Tax=Zhengella sp. TaxID=2282762 RepID=UPI001E0011EE|nr:acyl-CoA dehydrogenase family protein [Notoacmeibacter sp.]MCC0026544.1 acyl-CoA dehydrogenase family protein [Brucellaceae bacterium]